MPSFIIKGDCDDALAKLKSTLKAQDAKFEATLQSQFNLPAAPPRPVKPAPSPMPQRKPGAAYAAPAALEVVSSLPRTTSGKVRRADMRD